MKKTASLVTVLCFAAASVAHAQAGAESGGADRLRTTGASGDEAAAARAAHSMAQCVANKRPTASRRLLAATDARAMQNAHRSIWSNQLVCYSDFQDGDDRRFAVTSDVQRGLIAEHLLRDSDQQVTALAALPLRPGSYSRAWFAGTGRSATADQMAVCVAETSPAGIRAALMTEPYSAEEQQAFVELTPAMGQCLTAGAKLSGSRQAVRAALADALYQRISNLASSTMAAAKPGN